MRGAAPTSFFLLFLVAGCGFSTPAPAEPTPGEPPAARMGGVPTWAPPPTPQQAALLSTPARHTIKTPAERVFPDLARFAYANDKRLAGTDDAVKFARMVTQVLNDSPRFYVLQDLPAGAENTIAQYGPPAGEPDGFAVVRRSSEGLGVIVPAPGAPGARAALARGEALTAAGDLTGAVDAYRAASRASLAVPALRVALAAALAQAGRVTDAEAAYREAIAADSTYAPAHLGLAEIAERRGDRPAARRALIEALAYDPASARARALLGRFLPGPAGSSPAPAGPDGGWYDRPPPSAAAASRPAPFPIFLDVDASGAVHVAAEKSDAAQIYGGCRAVMRYEPSLRAQIFQQPPDTPYYLSVAEEVVCLEAGLGAYFAGDRRRPGAPPRDAALERLARIAREDGLSGYVMFEILGRYRPERARAAPPDVHADTVSYLDRWVLSRQEPTPQGTYTAER